MRLIELHKDYHLVVEGILSTEIYPEEKGRFSVLFCVLTDARQNYRFGNFPSYKEAERCYHWFIDKMVNGPEKIIKPRLYFALYAD